jgi:DNA-binding winged helix-turn-helix (wHTH) protein
MAGLAKIIDVHSHPILPYGQGAPVGLGQKQPDSSVESAISYMDEHHISVCVLSDPDSANHATGQEARDIARRINETLADIVSRHPRRFGAVATLPGQDAKGAVTEIAYALDILKMDGVWEPGVLSPVKSRETMLRAGSLEFHLIDRAARRGNRPIYLRPREFQLLKYMMQRSDHVLSFENLIKDVWHHKFVPETNRVNVHMGRLRAKVDGPNEAPMIRNVRGQGFILSAAQALSKKLTRTAGAQAERVDSNEL